MWPAATCKTSIGRRLSAKKYKATPKGQAARARYEHSPSGVAFRRRRQLKRKYGLTEADLDAAFHRQGWVCAICRAPDPGRRDGKWQTDHCHRSGKFRGVLCFGCNRMLGDAKDTPAVLRAGATYLED